MRDVWEKASEDLADALEHLLAGDLAGAPFERRKDRMLHIGLS